MADVPAAPLEGSGDTSTENRPILFLTEDDEAGGLRAALHKSMSSAVTNGQRLGVQSVGVEDGNDENAGTTTDAAVTTDTTGTLSGKLRGVVKFLFERMPASLGQKAMAASLAVTIASDQDNPSNITNTAVTVGAVSTAVLAAQATRRWAIFTNDDDESIYLAFNAAALMNKGIILAADGGKYEITRDTPWAGTVYAICASGGKNLCVMEGY